MVIDHKYLVRLIIPAIVLFVFSCRSGRNVFEGIPQTNYYDSCDAFHDFGKMIKIGDPADKFMISLPYDWDIREHYTDTLYSIVAANFMSIPIDLKDRMSFLVSGYKTDKDLETYYIGELKQMKKDPNINIEETGHAMIMERKSFWIKFNQLIGDHTAFSLVVYIKKQEQDEVYLLQSMVFDFEKQDIKLCYMKQLVNSFEIVDDN